MIIYNSPAFDSFTRISIVLIRVFPTHKKTGSIDPVQTVKKLIHCERKGSGNEAFPEFNPQAEFISAEENPVFLRPDKVQGFPQK